MKYNRTFNFSAGPAMITDEIAGKCMKTSVYSPFFLYAFFRLALSHQFVYICYGDNGEVRIV